MHTFLEKTKKVVQMNLKLGYLRVEETNEKPLVEVYSVFKRIWLIKKYESVFELEKQDCKIEKYIIY